MPELRGDVGLQLKWRRARPETGLALFVFVQALAALVRADRFEVLTDFTRETWLLLILLWAKNLFLALLAAALAAAAFRFVEAGRDAERPADWTRALVVSAAAALAFGAALRWVAPSLIPPAQFSDTFMEIEPALRDPLGLPWIGTTPWPGSHEQISNLYAHVTHAAVVAFGGDATGFLSVAAVPGTLLLPAMLWLGFEVGGPGAGVLALWLTAVAAWPLNVARWGHEGSPLLPLMAAGLAALLAGLRTRRAVWGLAAGACFGLALHTHPGAWATVGVLALWGVGRAAAFPKERRLAAAAALAGGLALAPFAAGFLREPSRLGGHLKDVHLQKPVRDVEAPRGAGVTGFAHRLAYNALAYTAIFTGAADPNVRHGLPAKAKLPILLGVAALFGAAGSFKAGAATPERALLVFAGGTLLAGVLSDPGGAPNSFRVCALVPPLLVWAAVSLRAAAARLGGATRTAPGIVVALAVSTVLAGDAVPFLTRWPFEESLDAAFDVAGTEAGRLLGLAGAQNVTLDPAVVQHPIVIEATARPVSFAPVPRWPLRAPDEGAGPGAGWYVSAAHRLDGLCAVRHCGRPIRLALRGPEVDLVRIGP